MSQADVLVHRGTACHSGLRISSLNQGALMYLALPNLIFLVGWLKPWIGWPVAAIIAALFWLIARRDAEETSAGNTSVPWRQVVLCATAAALWVMFSGIGHLVYINTDWVVRDAVLVDLTRRDWPVVYPGAGSATGWLLRAPLAYFLPAALIGKLAGIGAAVFALALWTWLGVTLTFVLLSRLVVGLRQLILMLAIWILFSGMDIVGDLFNHHVPSLGEHIEWWAKLYQYSSHTTQLFWVPNHALAGWIVVAWLVGQRPRELSAPFALAMGLCVPLWSPLTAAGLAPLMLVCIVAPRAGLSLRERLKPLLDLRWLVPAMLVSVAIYPYLLISAASVGGQWSEGTSASNGPLTLHYVWFLLIEYLFLALLLLRRYGLDWPLLGAIVLLAIFPAYHLGPGSDFTMRASIPALALIAARLGAWLANYWAPENGVAQKEDWSASLAALLFVLGAVTPAEEFLRAVTEPITLLELRTIPQAAQGYPPHYFAPVGSGWAKTFLR